MSFVQPAPEAADGGYWYVVPVVPDPELGGRTPGEIPGVGWCAWYGTVDGEEYTAVRLPDRRDVPQAVDIPVSAVIEGWADKPRGRIGGA